MASTPTVSRSRLRSSSVRSSRSSSCVTRSLRPSRVPARPRPSRSVRATCARRLTHSSHSNPGHTRRVRRVRRCLDGGVALTLAAPACAGLLQNIDLNNRDCQALILAPTRELASQIVKVVMAIGDYLGVSTMVRATPHARPPRPAAALLPPLSRGLAPVVPALAARGHPGVVARLRRPVSAVPAQGATGTHARTHPLRCTGSAAAAEAATHARRSVRHAGLCEVPTRRRRVTPPPPARQACIGGTNVRQDMDKLRAGVQLVVGTLDA